MAHHNALVFGATGGIGSAICRELNNREISCCIIGRSARKLAQLKKQLQIPSDNICCTPSITSNEGFEQSRLWLDGLNKGFSIAVHCAGYGLLKRASDISLEDWKSMIDINLNSAFSFYKLAREFKAADQFEMVYFGSASTDQAWPKNSLYGASKAGLEMFAQSLQKEIRPEGGRVWLYKPGSVRTHFFDQLPNHIPGDKMIDPAILAKLVVENLWKDQSVYLSGLGIYSE